MTIYLGADHGGFALKELVKTWLSGEGKTVIDCGNTLFDPQDDFPDYAFAVADRVAGDPGSFGILICRSAGGMTIAANKVAGVRCVTGTAVSDVRHNRDNDDANVLALGGDYLDETQAKELIAVFLETPFSGEPRFVRRLEKIHTREQLH